MIFSDKCSVHMDSHAKLSFRQHWEPPQVKGRAKHPYKVHIWAGIFKRGATNLLIFTGNMDTAFYCRSKRFLRRPRCPSDGYLFQQDNNPKHTRRLVKEYMEMDGINWRKTSPEVCIWTQLSFFGTSSSTTVYLRMIVKLTTKGELVAGIMQFWGNKWSPTSVLPTSVTFRRSFQW